MCGFWCSVQYNAGRNVELVTYNEVLCDVFAALARVLTVIKKCTIEFLAVRNRCHKSRQKNLDLVYKDKQA